MVKVYRNHNCTSKHNGYRTLLTCMTKDQVFGMTGDGPYVVFGCKGERNRKSASLWRTEEIAKAERVKLDAMRCGGPCTGDHEVIQLVEPSTAEPWPVPTGKSVPLNLRKDCPQCKAEAGQPCEWTDSKVRESTHTARRIELAPLI